MSVGHFPLKTVIFKLTDFLDPHTMSTPIRSVILLLPVEMHTEIVQYLRPDWKTIAAWVTTCRNVYLDCKHLLFYAVPLTALPIIAGPSTTLGAHPALSIRRLRFTPGKRGHKTIPANVVSVIDDVWSNIERHLDIPSVLQLTWSLNSSLTSVFSHGISPKLSSLTVLKIQVRHYDSENFKCLVRKSHHHFR